jgi:hypothetical protein
MLRERREIDRSPGRGTFFKGFLSGLLAAAAIGVGLAVWWADRPPRFLIVAAESYVKKMAASTALTMPFGHLRRRQEDLAEGTRRFVLAFCQERISQEDAGELAGRFFGAAEDRMVTADEVDGILDSMNRMSR